MILPLHNDCGKLRLRGLIEIATELLVVAESVAWGQENTLVVFWVGAVWPYSVVVY